MSKKTIPAAHRHVIDALAASANHVPVADGGGQVAWNAALADVEAAWADMTDYHASVAERFRGHGLTEQVMAAEEFGCHLVGIHYDCFRQVFATPAPDLPSLMKALRRFAEWEMQIEDDQIELLVSQLERLSGQC